MNKKTQQTGRADASVSPAKKTLHHSISPTKSFNSEHTLPSPCLSNKDFDYIPGRYVEAHFYFKKYGGFNYAYE